MMRILIGAALAASLVTTNLMAADLSAPLTSGKPAGVSKAQGEDNTPLYIVLGVAAVAGIAIAASSGGNSNGSAGSGTTTAVTGTTG